MDFPLLLFNFAFALLAAPILNGLIKSRKASWQNRRGPGILQPWHDLIKYLGRESVVSEHTSWLFRLAPYVYFGAFLLAAGLVPAVTTRSPLGGFGDAVVLVGLFALARFALALAALDTASNFAGMGTSRELAFAALGEPALMLALFAIALPAGGTDLGAMAAAPMSPSRLLAFAALGVVAVAETGRIPIDNPDTHLELTMAHEGMLLEYSGRPLGLLLWATHIKQLVVLSLLAMLIPGGTNEPGAVPLLVGLGMCLAKLTVLGVALAFVETINVKMRIFRVPELLGAAALIGLLAVVAIHLIG